MYVRAYKSLSYYKRTVINKNNKQIQYQYLRAFKHTLDVVDKRITTNISFLFTKDNYFALSANTHAPIRVVSSVKSQSCDKAGVSLVRVVSREFL